MSELILDQNAGEISKTKFGLFPMSYNGCEVIAVYNAMHLLGKDCEIKKLIKHFYKAHLCLWFGLWGSNVKKLNKAVRNMPVICKRISLQYLLSARNGVYVICFWNHHAPWHGIHTVACEVRDGLFTTYNLYRGGEIYHLSPKEYTTGGFICAYKLEKE